MPCGISSYTTAHRCMHVWLASAALQRAQGIRCFIDKRGKEGPRQGVGRSVSRRPSGAQRLVPGGCTAVPLQYAPAGLSYTPP